MVNGICKYCKLKSCEGSNNEGGSCPPQLMKLLEILMESIHSHVCNVDYLVDKVKISRDELDFLVNKYFDCTPKRMIENLKLEIVIMSIDDSCNEYQLAKISGYEIGTFRKAFIRRFNNNFSYYQKIIIESSNTENLKRDLINGLWQTSPEKLYDKII